MFLVSSVGDEVVGRLVIVIFSGGGRFGLTPRCSSRCFLIIAIGWDALTQFGRTLPMLVYICYVGFWFFRIVGVESRF